MEFLRFQKYDMGDTRKENIYKQDISYEMSKKAIEKRPFRLGIRTSLQSFLQNYGISIR